MIQTSLLKTRGYLKSSFMFKFLMEINTSLVVHFQQLGTRRGKTRWLDVQFSLFERCCQQKCCCLKLLEFSNQLLASLRPQSARLIRLEAVPVSFINQSCKFKTVWLAKFGVLVKFIFLNLSQTDLKLFGSAPFSQGRSDFHCYKKQTIF